MISDLKTRLAAEAQDIGFDACRICRPWDVPQVPESLQTFVDQGRHGQMGWMAERMHWRSNPAALWPEARSVIMLAESYTPEHDPLEILEQTDRGAISVYAQNKDYHDMVKKRLKRLARWLIADSGGEVKAPWRCCWTWLARQAYEPREPSNGQLVLFRVCFYNFGPACG